jgi:glycolate oxidase
MIANRYKVPVGTISSGVNVASLVVPPDRGILLDLRMMNQILEINTDSGYAVIEPGCNFDKLSGALREKGFRFQMPTAPGGATPVGNHLLKPSGSLSTRHLDSMLDLEVVLPDGSIIKTGSSHFDGAGSSLRYGPFPDLTGLYCCSYGTLGVVTKAAVKIYPINECSKVVLAGFDTFAAAVDFIKDTIANNIPEHCIIWNWSLYQAFNLSDSENTRVTIPESFKNDPFDAPPGFPYCMVTSFLSGYEESVNANVAVSKRVAEKHGGKQLTDEEARALLPVGMKGWDKLYADYRPQVPIALYGIGRNMVWIVHNEPKDIKELEKWAVRELDNEGIRPVCYYAHPFDFGRSVFFRLFAFAEASDHALRDKIGAKFSQMYDVAMKKYNALPYRYNVQDYIRGTGGYYDLLKKIKLGVDPNNILNPGLNLFDRELFEGENK